ncbi:MAG: cytochrome c biogenesis protein CcsA [Myxococcales bacterium]|jgi:ABC-type uncharacterized transport system permease subunit|nr:cytochrome c biogenesis protein CcsA [Myxococcales bacterium]
MPVTLLFITTVALYVVAWLLDLSSLFRGAKRSGTLARRLLGVAAASHVAYIAAEFFAGGQTPIADLNGTLSTLSLGVVLAYLLVQRSYTVPALGAFVTPITLVFLLGAALVRGVAEVPPPVASALLQVHIAFNILGLVAFTVAFAASTAYVIQEHLLRKKRIGGAFRQLPSLGVLDSISAHATNVGFPLLTAGVVTGALFVTQSSASLFSGAQAMGLLTWIVFAGVVVLRLVGGWRGRRAAFGTIMGFACGVSVLAAYAVKLGSGA